MASKPAEGLLIVNADDWGASSAVSEAILTCFDAGRISSATAMMYMPDSQPAVERAKSVSLPVGLHLNLTEPFGDPRTPPDVRDRQARVAAYFSRQGHRRWLFNPLIASAVDQAIADQLQRFVALYSRMPTHVDGHMHVHLYPNVLFSRALPKGIKVRRSFTFASDEPSTATRAVHQAVNVALDRRFRSTDRFFSIDPVNRARMNGTVIADRISMSTTRTVEVMAHPGDPNGYSFLMSDEWARLIERRPLGSFDDLA